MSVKHPAGTLISQSLIERPEVYYSSTRYRRQRIIETTRKAKMCDRQTRQTFAKRMRYRAGTDELRQMYRPLEVKGVLRWCCQCGLYMTKLEVEVVDWRMISQPQLTSYTSWLEIVLPPTWQIPSDILAASRIRTLAFEHRA